MSDAPCRCLVCTNGIPVTCARTEQAIRADERNRLGDLIRAASDQRHIAELLKAIEDDDVRRRAGMVTHVIYALLCEEE